MFVNVFCFLLCRKEDVQLEDNGPLHTRPPETFKDLSPHVVTFQDHISIDQLISYLVAKKILTTDEIHTLTFKETPPRQRVLQLISVILPSKHPDGMKSFTEALINSLNEEGNSGIRVVLKEVFDIGPNEISATAKGGSSLLNAADTVSAESKEFGSFLVNFRKILEKGSKKAVNERLKDLADYLYILQKSHSNDFLLNESSRAKLSSVDSFSELFKCLHNSCIISSGDVSILKVIIGFLEENDSAKKVVDPLKRLVDDYEEKAAIKFIAREPSISDKSGSIKVDVTNARGTNPKLKNGVRKAISQVFGINFLGSGSGSVVLYWEFPREYFHRVFESFDCALKSKPDLLQFRIRKVDVSTNVPYQIYLKMDIIDRNLFQLSQQQHFVADDVSPEQKKFAFLLIRINRMVGECANLYLSSTREEISRFYSCFEGYTFLKMVDNLVSENKLHCYDVSYIQFFLHSLYKWDATHGKNNATLLKELLLDTQEYEPVAIGSQLPSLTLQTESHPFTITTFVSGIGFLSYEVMMSLKFAFSYLFRFSPSCFQYTHWRKSGNKCCIVWRTTGERFYEMESTLCYNLSAGFLRTTKHPEVRYHNIIINCMVDNMQMLMDGSPLLLPNVEGMFVLNYSNPEKIYCFPFSCILFLCGNSLLI